MTRNWNEATAENVRAVMARKKKRGTELAVVLGLSQTAASRRMNGATPFDVNELCETAAWLDVPITELLPQGVNTITSGLYGGNPAVVDTLVAA